MSTRLILIFSLLVGLGLLISSPLVSASSDPDRSASPLIDSLTPPDPTDAIERLTKDSQDTARVSFSRATGTVNFIRLKAGALPYKAADLTARQFDSQAAAFLTTYGAAFGLQNPNTELQAAVMQQDHLGTWRLTYPQVYEGVPVFAGLLHVHFDAGGQLVAVNGNIVPDLKLNPIPTLSSRQAAKQALAFVAGQYRSQYGREPAGLAVEAARLYIYRTNLAQGRPGTNYLVYEALVGNRMDVREFVYVDAHSGKIVDQITGRHTIDRRIYNGGFGGPYLVWTEGAPYPYVGPDAVGINHLIDYAEDTYNLFASMTNGSFLSWDAAGAAMHSVLNDPFISCPNAVWDGVSTNYCSDVSGDDTVGHEWAHAYTDSTHNLIYQWQTGALNEAYSDIWGELVDLLNGDGLDSPGGPRSAGGCSLYGAGASDDNSYRWLSGEDDPGFGGAIRDMWTPTCYGDPGKVSDVEYWCGTADSGGVHVNSGIPNHAFALLVDGGDYNGRTIDPIGLTKAAQIYWRAQHVYQHPATDFYGHADALTQACTDLLGQPLYALSANSPVGVLSGETIGAADCAAVGQAIAAVELRAEPTQCGFSPLLASNAPLLCADRVSLLTADWENGLQHWQTGSHSVVKPGTFDTPDWAVVSGLPDGRPGAAAFVADDPALGDCGLDTEAGVLYLESPPVIMPAGAGPLRLAFDHWVATETSWDGGNLKISVNNGPWTLVPASAFTFNAYPGSLKASDNPLSGEPAFTGTDEGSVSGSWGQSQVDLSALVAPGDEVRLRFELGLDGCNGTHGWYVDDVELYYCSGAPGFTLTAAPHEQSICAPEAAGYAVNVGQQLGFAQPVALSLTGQPASAAATFAPAAVIPPGSSQLTIDNTDQAAPGRYDLEITGDAAGSTERDAVRLNLFDAVPGQTMGQQPATGATNQSLTPAFSWLAASQGLTYTLSLSTDPCFANIVTQAKTTGAGYTVTNRLMPNTTYYWGVTAENSCGPGATAAVPHRFTTADSPSILLVDDDADTPDVTGYYTRALTALALAYDTWDTGAAANSEPTATDLAAYQTVIWFTGDNSLHSVGPEIGTEAILGNWLDGGGRCLLLSSQDYHWDRGLTPFMQTYLGVAAVADDVGQTAVTGQGAAFGGLGPYALSFPFGVNNFSDVVTPTAAAASSFLGDQGPAGVSKAGSAYKTTFLGFPLPALPNDSARADVLRRFITWCNVPLIHLDKTVSPDVGVTAGETVTYTLAFENRGLVDVADAVVTDTLPASLTFARWIERPAAATVSGPAPQQISWQGPLAAGQALTFTFVTTFTGQSGCMVSNVASYSYTSQTTPRTAQASFTIGATGADQSVFLPLLLKQ